jgi:hypothetical protein
MPKSQVIVVKDPNDSRTFTFDCTSDLAQYGTTIASIVSLVATPTGLTFAGNAIVGSSLMVSSLVSGGTHGVQYDAVLTYTTADGQTLEASGSLRVANSTQL